MIGTSTPSLPTAQALTPDRLPQDAATPSHHKLEAREAFQSFVAGTFYKQMLKSLRSTVDKSSKFHGGQAEDMFQGQLDQQVAEDLAATHGAAFADKLYAAFVNNRHA